MRAAPAHEFPPERARAFHRALRLEWLTVGYLLTVIVIMYSVLGASQAMKTAWLEDLLGLVPPIVVLIAARIAIRTPSERFPYGYHRAVSLAFLVAAVALLGMGGWLFVDSAVKLLRAERTTIGGVTLAGHTFWLGWLMLPALVWSALPSMFLGRAKLPVARAVHDKVLRADASMNKADWQTAAAAMVGILGVAWGYWWADAAAAAVISVSIVRDGWRNLREVVSNLMDEAPKTVDGDRLDPLPEQVASLLRELPWVADAQVRMREEGHVYFGEAFVVVADDEDLTARLEQAVADCTALDWRMHELVIMPVSRL